MCECKPDPMKQKLSFDQQIMLSQVILLNGCLLKIGLRLNCKLNISYHTEVHYSQICCDDYSYRRMCSWTRWLSVSHSSCTLTFFHFSQKFKRGPRWLLFSFCEKRGTVSEPTKTATVYTSVETCTQSQSLSSSSQTSWFVHTTGFKWSRRLPNTKSEMTSERNSWILHHLPETDQQSI